MKKPPTRATRRPRLSWRTCRFWRRIRRDATLKRCELVQARAAKEEAAETERDTKVGKQTAHALNEVAWYALFAREFTQALSAADRAHALLPGDLEIDINRAHALMFLGRGEESEALYLAHKGERMSDEDSSLWERVIAKDFVDLRKAGLPHPMMAEIEKKLGVYP